MSTHTRNGDDYCQECLGSGRFDDPMGLGWDVVCSSCGGSGVDPPMYDGED